MAELAIKKPSAKEVFRLLGHNRISMNISHAYISGCEKEAIVHRIEDDTYWIIRYSYYWKDNLSKLIEEDEQYELQQVHPYQRTETVYLTNHEMDLLSDDNLLNDPTKKG